MPTIEAFHHVDLLRLVFDANALPCAIQRKCEEQYTKNVPFSTLGTGSFGDGHNVGRYLGG